MGQEELELDDVVHNVVVHLLVIPPVRRIHRNGMLQVSWFRLVEWANGIYQRCGIMKHHSWQKQWAIQIHQTRRMSTVRHCCERLLRFWEKTSMGPYVRITPHLMATNAFVLLRRWIYTKCGTAGVSKCTYHTGVSLQVVGGFLQLYTGKRIECLITCLLHVGGVGQRCRSSSCFVVML